MRVVVDTNVLFSALFYPSPDFTLLILRLTTEHEMLIPEHVAQELRATAILKRPKQAALVHDYLRTLGVPLSEDAVPEFTVIRMRDPKDQPILDAAIAADADVVITGDNDFLALEIDRPRIMRPREFLDEFISE
jgi:putative PIN family toxin of toxin-antitoxin system